MEEQERDDKDDDNDETEDNMATREGKETRMSKNRKKSGMSNEKKTRKIKWGGGSDRCPRKVDEEVKKCYKKMSTEKER